MPNSILRPYFLVFRNRFRFRHSSSDLKRDLLLLLVAILVMVCIFFGFVIILNSLQSDALFRQVFPAKIVQLLFYAFLVLLLLSNTISAIGNIYTAQNMNLLLSTPVSTIRLYFAKLLETIVETSLMFVVFIVPVGLSYYHSLNLKPWFFLGSLLAIIPFLIIPAGAGIIIATVFVRLSSLFWKRGSILFLGVLLTGAWAFGKVLSLLHQIETKKGSTNALVQVLGLFDNPNPIWLPSRWAVDLICWFITGSVDYPLLKFALLWGTAVGVTALGYLFFDFLLLPVRSAAGVHERIDDGQSKQQKKPSLDLTRHLLELLYRHLPINIQFRAIMLKDVTSLFRDRAQSLQLLMYLGIALVALTIIEFMSAALSLSPIALQSWWGFLAGVNVLFTGFIITALMTRLVYPSISLEGKAFWILITAPLEPEKIVRAKFLCWLPLVTTVAVALLIAGVYAIHPSTILTATSIYIGLCLSFGCTGLAIGIGSMFASFEWESPNQISAGFGTLVLLLSSLVLVLLTVVPGSVLLFLSVVPRARMKLGPELFPLVAAGCAFAVFALNFFVSFYARKKGAASLATRSA